MRYMLTDELWAVMGPLVERAKRHKAGQKPETPDRVFFEAVLYWARTGVPWRDLPAEFGSWDAVYNRLRRWVYSGSLQALFELLTAGADLAFDGDPQRHACIDRDVCPVIPNKANRIEPWPFDPEPYRERNKVERLFGKLKQFRRVATRYEKRRAMFLGVLHLALGFIR